MRVKYKLTNSTMVLCVIMFVIINVQVVQGSQDYSLTLVLVINCITISNN